MNWYSDLITSNFSAFIEKTFATVDPGAEYLPNWHIDLIAEYLEAARRGEINRLIINMPPRALKSQSVSIAWPAWLLGHDPSSRIIAASYSSSLAIRHSLDSRQIVTSPWYKAIFPKTILARDQNEKHKFMTSRRGFRFATSVGGTLTGEGGNFLIIDDPLNPAQAANKLLRDNVNRWYDSTFSTRLNDKKRGVIVLVMQRLHADDLTAHLLDKGGFTHLCLPAVAEKAELIDFGEARHFRAIGELLHPEREDIMLIERAKRELGTQAFAAQYQQKPLAEQSELIRREWFKRYANVPNPERIVQSWDTAIKAENHHDASVCLTFYELDNISYLVDARIARQEYPELKRFVITMAEQFSPHMILIEDKSSGQQLLQDLQRETSLPVVAVKNNASKIMRFSAVSAMIEAGRLSLPHNSPWLAAFEQEIMEFPNGRHDDQVDAMTQYLDMLRKKSFDKLWIRSI